MPKIAETIKEIDLDKVERLKASIAQSQGAIPFKKLPAEDAAILDKLLKAAPYYILRYGDDAIEFMRDKLGAPFPLNLVYKGILWGFKQLQKRFYIE